MNDDTAFLCSECNANLNSISSQNNGQSPYVGFWRRFGALFIDSIIVAIAGSIVTPIVANLFSESIILMFSSSVLLSLAIGIAYYAGLESSEKQATFGKQVFGVKVTDLEGNRISFGKATARYLLKMIFGMIFGIGYLFIIFSEKKQGLYDMIVGTVVVYK
jgi:uncharacterized RDD family membrane protein YckC